MIQKYKPGHKHHYDCLRNFFLNCRIIFQEFRGFETYLILAVFGPGAGDGGILSARAVAVEDGDPQVAVVAEERGASQLGSHFLSSFCDGLQLHGTASGI